METLPLLPNQRPVRLSPGLILIGLFVLLVISVGITLFWRFNSQPKGGFDFVAPVTTAKVQARSIPLDYRTVGTLEANQYVDMNPQVMGIIKGILFEEGQWVKEGQALMQLDVDKQRADVLASDAQAEQASAALASLEADLKAKQETVNAAEAQKSLAEKEYARYKNLWDKEFVSTQQVDEVGTRLKVAQADLALARQQMESARARLAEAQAGVTYSKARSNRTRADYNDTMVRAPFSGQIGMKYVNVGDYVMPGEKLLTLVQSNPLKITVPIPERYASLLKKGIPLELKTENQPGKVYTGAVHFIDPVVAKGSRTVTIRALVQNPHYELQAGQFANIRVVFGSRENALTVPEESVIPQGEKYFVYTVKGGKAVFTPVKVGNRIPGRVEILSGLTPGDRVVTGGIQKVQDGAPVKELSASGPSKTGPSPARKSPVH